MKTQPIFGLGAPLVLLTTWTAVSIASAIERATGVSAGSSCLPTFSSMAAKPQDHAQENFAVIGIGLLVTLKLEPPKPARAANGRARPALVACR